MLAIAWKIDLLEALGLGIVLFFGPVVWIMVIVEEVHWSISKRHPNNPKDRDWMERHNYEKW